MTVSVDGTTPLEALGGYVRTFTASVITAGQPITSTPLATLDVISGSITIDATRDVRTTLSSLTIADPDRALVPTSSDSLLSPLGREIVVYETRSWPGASGAAATTLTCPLGVFTFDVLSAVETTAGVTLSLDGQDAAAQIMGARWVDPYVVANGAAVDDVIAGIVSNRWPAYARDVSSVTTETLPRAIFDAGPDSDPWADCVTIAKSRGLDVYFSSSGVLTIEPTPVPLSSARRWTLTDGVTATVLSVSVDYDTQSTYSGVVVTGESTGAAAPVRAILWDDDPASPTFRDGPFGLRPFWYSSPLIVTVAQAQAAARARFDRKAGVQQRIEWTQAPIPLDVGDVVRLERPALGISADVVVDSIEMPLSPTEGFKCKGRARTSWT